MGWDEGSFVWNHKMKGGAWAAFQSRYFKG